MKYRNVMILPPLTLTGAQTRTINIHIKDVISRMTVVWSVTKVKIGMTSYAHRDITRIELVDGSDVLFSMNGGEAAALMMYDRPCPTYWDGEAINGMEIYSQYGIDFGRWIFDEVLALDPSRFSNLQLKVTVNPELCELGGSAGELSVHADVFDEQRPAPAGFLMSKEHYSAVMGGTGSHTYVDLPTDFPIRKMIVQGYLASKEPWNQVHNVRIDEENEKRVPLDWPMYEYFVYRKGIDIPVQEHIASQAEAGGTLLFTTPTDYWCTLVTVAHAAGGIFVPAGASPGGVFTVTPNAGTAYQAIVKGWLPNHCFHFPFGYQKDISDWYDVTKLGHVRLRLTAGTHDAAGMQAVVLQQNRSY